MMQKQLIIQELTKRHTVFIDYILSLSYQQFMFSYQNKWTAGQQLDHIVRAVAVFSLVFKIPQQVITLLFGKTTRPLMEYDVLVKKYLLKLNTGATASFLFIPKKIRYNNRHRLAGKLLQNINLINLAIAAIPDESLDTRMLPHPILGKLTYREMLYFTLYHVDHHFALTNKYVAENNKL